MKVEMVISMTDTTKLFVAQSSRPTLLCRRHTQSQTRTNIECNNSITYRHAAYRTTNNADVVIETIELGPWSLSKRRRGGKSEVHVTMITQRFIVFWAEISFIGTRR